jgi:mono/diheme cytochrome c family protein
LNCRKRTARAFLSSLVLCLTSLPLLSPDFASAQTGEQDFQSYCAQCHGENGKGGSGAGIKGPDLTSLSQKNGGKFPFEEVYQVIDGRKMTAAHKRLMDMPLWGVYFQPQGASEAASEAKVKSRITDLARYVRSLQKQ